MTWVSFDGESSARERLLHPSFLLSDSMEGLGHVMTSSCINDSSNWQVDVPKHVPWALGPASQTLSLSPRPHHQRPSNFSGRPDQRVLLFFLLY